MLAINLPCFCTGVYLPYQQSPQAAPGVMHSPVRQPAASGEQRPQKRQRTAVGAASGPTLGDAGDAADAQLRDAQPIPIEQRVSDVLRICPFYQQTVGRGWHRSNLQLRATAGPLQSSRGFVIALLLHS